MNIDFICIVSFHGVLVKESAFLRKCAVEKKKINDYKVKVTTVCSLFFSFLLKKKQLTAPSRRLIILTRRAARSIC